MQALHQRAGRGTNIAVDRRLVDDGQTNRCSSLGDCCMDQLVARARRNPYRQGDKPLENQGA